MRQDILDALGLICYQRRACQRFVLWIVGDRAMLNVQDHAILFRAILQSIGLTEKDVGWGSMRELECKASSIHVNVVWVMTGEMYDIDKPMIQSPPLPALLYDPHAKKMLYGALMTLCNVN